MGMDEDFGQGFRVWCDKWLAKGQQELSSISFAHSPK